MSKFCLSRVGFSVLHVVVGVLVAAFGHVVSLPARADALERVVFENGFLSVECIPALSGRVSKVTAGTAESPIAFAMPAVTLRRPPVPEHDPSSGGTLWLSPQSDWWRHQRIEPSLRRRLPTWPPDPYGERADFQVDRPNARSIVFKGPVSPVTGMRLTKGIQFLSRDTIEWRWTAQNRTWGIRRWGLWPNFRFDPHTEFWIWNPDRETPRWSGEGQLPRGTTRQQGAWLVVDGSRTSRSGKISLRHWSGRAVFFHRDLACLVTAQHVAASSVAQGHDPLEIFLNAEVGQSGGRCTEFEFHGPRRWLAPLGVMSLSQKWQVKQIPVPQSAIAREALAGSLLDAGKLGRDF